jgi:protocatechuate 3,4-dioxygenase beta subunit
MPIRARLLPALLTIGLVVPGCLTILYFVLDGGNPDADPEIDRPLRPDPVSTATPLETTKAGTGATSVPTPSGPSPAEPGGADPGNPTGPGGESPGAAVPETGKTAPTGAVRGRVLDPDGRPLEGVAVAIARKTRKALGLIRRGPDLATAKTDSEGCFELDPVPVGRHYGLLLRHERFPDFRKDGVEVTIDATTDLGTIKLTAGAGVSGQVRSVESGPLVGVEVRVMDPVLPEAFGGRTPAATRTDRDGRFRFTLLKPGQVRIEARAPDHAPGRREITLEPGREVGNVEIILRRGLAIHGEVVDERDQLVPGVRVLAAGDQQHSVEARTDANGRFELRNLMPGIYRLVCAKRGYGRPAGDRSPRDFVAGTKGVRVRLERRAVIEGVVLDAAGRKPIAEFAIAWGRPGQLLDDWRSFQAEDGRFVLDGLQPGPIDLEVKSPRHAPRRLGSMTLGRGDHIRNLEVLLSAGGSATGRIVERGTRKPLAAVRVLATRTRKDDTSVVFGGEALDPPRPFRAATTDADGRFRLSHLTGPFTLKIRHSEHAPRDLGPIRFPESGVVDLGDLDLGVGGTVTGFVPDRSGKGDSKAEVWIHGKTGFNRTVQTDANGRFTLRRVPPGVYDVILTRRGGKLSIEDLVRMTRSGQSRVEVFEGKVSVVQF